jgi:hypothetical protein
MGTVRRRYQGVQVDHALTNGAKKGIVVTIIAQDQTRIQTHDAVD